MESQIHKYSKKYFENIGREIQEIRFLVARSVNPGEISLYILPKNESISKGKIIKALRKRIDLNGWWNRGAIQIIFLKASIIEVIE